MGNNTKLKLQDKYYHIPIICGLLKKQKRYTTETIIDGRNSPTFTISKFFNNSLGTLKIFMTLSPHCNLNQNAQNREY